MINVGDAVVKLGLDKTKFNEGMRNVGDETGKSMNRVKDSMRIAAIAITAVGVAGLVLVDKARKMNAELGQVAITTGIARGELQDLALDLSNVTFRLGSVIDTLTLLSRAGITNKDDMKDIANAFDALADATGSSAEIVADQLIPAFRVFGLDLPKTADDLDNITWLLKNTLITLPDFASVMDYVAMYGSNLNITLDDMVAILTVLDEKGISGASATRLFRTAVSQAADGTVTLNDALGITNSEMDNYIQKISVDAVGATQAYADAANEQFGIMDKLKAAWEDMTFVMGSFLTPLEPVFALFTALGPLLLTLSITTLPGLVTNIKTSIIWIGNLAVAAGKAVVALVAKAAASIWASLGPLGIVGIALATAGVIALIASLKSARTEAAALAEGGIVRRPTMALIGEAGPEAVIPLSQAGLTTGTKEIHIHIGNYMGDDASRRKLMRDLKQWSQEDDRRNAFGQVGQGYYYGRSSL